MPEKCPFAPPDNTDIVSLKPRELIVLAAQNYLDAPELAEDITDTLGDNLWKYYRQTSYSTENRLYLRSRGMRQAVTSSLNYVADMTFMARITALLENAGGIGKPAEVSKWDYKTRFVSSQKGVLHDFIQTLYGRSAMATAACFAAINSGDLETYKPVYDMRKEIHEEFYFAKRIWNAAADKNEPMPHRDPMQNWLGGIAENVALTLAILAHNNIDYAETHANVTAEQLTANALRNISILQAPTTLNLSASVHARVDTRFTGIERWLLATEDENKLPYEHMIFYTPEGDTAHWAHPTLRKGPWKTPRFCAANIALEAPNYLDGGIIDRFNAAILDVAGVDSGLSGERAFTSATIILAAGVLVARETIDPAILNRAHVLR